MIRFDWTGLADNSVSHVIHHDWATFHRNTAAMAAQSYSRRSAGLGRVKAVVVMVVGVVEDRSNRGSADRRQQQQVLLPVLHSTGRLRGRRMASNMLDTTKRAGAELGCVIVDGKARQCTAGASRRRSKGNYNLQVSGLSATVVVIVVVRRYGQCTDCARALAQCQNTEQLQQ